MSKYINHRIYTDVESYLVTESDEVKETAMAIRVEKRIRPTMIPGGFAVRCPNLNREFAEAEAVIPEGEKSFPIQRNKDGIWGFKLEVGRFFPLAAFTEEGKAQMIALGSLRSIDRNLELTEAYHRDRGEKMVPARTFESVETYKQECDCEYLYLFDNGRWLIYGLYNDPDWNELNVIIGKGE